MANRTGALKEVVMGKACLQAADRKRPHAVSTGISSRHLLAAVLLGLFALLLALLPSACGSSQNAAQETGRDGAMAAVPELAGLSLEEAERALREAGLEKGELTEEFSETAPSGTVTASRPPAGEELPAGSRVDLVTSKGPEPVPVPDLNGRGEGEAVSHLQSLGLRAEVRRVYSESVPAGAVISTEPAPGTSLQKGSTVAVTVSLGSAYRTCPTCSGSGVVEVAVACPECGGSGECPT